MTPFIADIIAIVIAAGLILSGWHYGFVRTLGSLIGLVASIAVAIYGATWIEATFGFSFLQNPLTGVVLFLLLALIVSHVAGWLVNLLDLARRVLSIIPFVGLINSMLGALLGAVQATCIIVAVAFVAVTFMPDSATRTAILGAQSVGKAVDVLYQFGWL